MIENIILFVIIGITVSTVLVFLTRATSKSITPNQSGQYILRMNRLYGILGVIGLVFGLLFMIFLSLSADENDGRIWIMVVFMLLIFWGAGIPCLMYYRNHKVTFNENSITATNVYGKVKEIKWSDILDIKFKVFSGQLVLKTKDEVIKVHQHLVGLSKFVAFIENKIKWTRKELRIPLEINETKPR